jgi:DNA adenine methylase
MTTPIRPPVKWHGGKFYLAERIVRLFPPHRVYVEPFGGGASVLLNKPPADVEVYNDLDERVVRLFRVLRNDFDEFVRRLRLTPYAQREFADAADCPAGADDVERARCDFVRWRQSFGGKGQSFSYTTARSRRGMADVVSGYLSAVEGLADVVNRLRRVQFMCQPAAELIPRYNLPDALVYCDPPYAHGTRADPAAYRFEMTDDDHRALAGVLAAHAGPAAVSGYRCPLYDELYGRWHRTEFDVAMHAAGGSTKSRATECVWTNYPPPAAATAVPVSVAA